MDDDAAAPRFSRRRILLTPPGAVAGIVGAVGAGQAVTPPALAAPRTVERICRGAWGAQPPAGEFVRHEILRLTVHHSAVALRDNRDAPGQLRAFQQDHQSRGWPDLAYHVVVDRHGNVYRGRPPWAVADTATPYDPTGHLLVLCMGNFEVQTVPAAQLGAVVDVLAWASARYGVAPATISGHRDHVATLCPGDALYRLIDDGTIRRRVTRRVGAVRMTNLCGRAGRRRVRLIETGTA